MVDIPHELATAPGVRSSDLAALIWTTTPWTLPANEAIAVHAEILYAVMESASHGQLLVAESQIPSVVATCFDAPPRLVKGSIPGRILAGRTTYRHPLRRTGSKPQPIIHADFVSDGSGSGLVHCAPGHGMEDYEVCRRHGLPVTSPVDDQGRFVRDELLSQPDRLQGRDVLSDGSQHALEWLREREAVVKTDVIRHKYPYDWRSRRPVIVRATEQWFANVDRIKGAATKSLDAVRFLPPSGRARLESFLAGRSEWCISRQRAWGVPIPALYHEQRGEALMTPESVSHVISVIEQRGIDAWWSDPDDDPAWTPPECREASGATGYRRGKDTLDVWFDSGTSWTQMKHMPIAGREALADVYLEGTDQHRGWFQSSLLTYTAHQRPTSAAADAVPELPLFKKLVTHGFTLDAAGRKMSKSVGNVVSPAEIMAGILLSSSKKKGPDQEVRPIPGRGAQWLDLATLRVWVASSDYTKDVAISQQSLTAIRESTRKIGLTLKWLLGVLSDFDPSRAVPYSELSELDRMALLQLAHVNEKVFELFKTYEFYKGTCDCRHEQYLGPCRADDAAAMPVISSWLNADLSAFYFDLIKDRLYCDEKQGLDRQRAQTVLLHIFNHLLGLLAPIVPHLVERAWRRTPAAISETKEHPLHRVYPSVPPEWLNPDLASELPRLLEAKAAVNTALELARREGKLQQSIESIIALTFSDRAAGEPCKGYALFERYKDELAELFVVAGVHLVRSSKPSDASDPTSEQEQATPTSQTSSTVYEHSNNQPDKAVELSSRTFQTIDNESVTVQVFRSSMEKCHRCWKHTAWRPASAPTDQSQSAESEIDVLCRRCQDVVDHWRQSKPAEFQAAFAASAPTSPVPTL